MHPHKLRSILNLPAPERYGYLIRKVADSETIWLLRDEDGITILADDTEQAMIPVWPEEAFAALLLVGEWQAYQIEEMPVEEFLAWLDELQAENIRIAAFPTETLQSIVVEAQELKNHLLHELTQYQ